MLIGTDSWVPWEKQEGAKLVDGPVMEMPELVAGDIVLVWLGQGPPGRVEDVAARLLSMAHCCKVLCLLEDEDWG